MTTLAADIAKINADGNTLHSIVHGPSGTTVTTESGQCPTVAETLARIAGGNLRGEWVTGTLYAVNDVVTNSGTGYRAIIGHTAGATFAGDAAKWVVVSASQNIALDQLAAVAQSVILGRAAGAGTGQVTALTPAQVQAIIAAIASTWMGTQTFTGDVGGAGIRFGLRNAIINGCFRKWDYATSYAGTSYGGPNRWAYTADGSTHVSSRQSFTLGQTDVPGELEYFHRTVVTSSAGASNRVRVTQAIEGVRTFAGKTVTLSFYAKADASKNIAIEMFQDFGSGGSPSSAVIGIGVNKVALTTSWQKITLTIAIPSITGKTVGTNRNDNLALSFWFDAGADYNARTDSLGQQSGTFDIARVRLVEGTQDGDADAEIPIGLLDMLCARYLPVIKTLTGSNADIGLVGQCATTTDVYFPCVFPVRPRTAPTGCIVNGGHGVSKADGTLQALNSLAFYSATQHAATIKAVASAPTLTAGHASRLLSSSVSSEILFTGCEL